MTAKTPKTLEDRLLTRAIHGVKNYLRYMEVPGAWKMSEGQLMERSRSIPDDELLTYARHMGTKSLALLRKYAPYGGAPEYLDRPWMQH